MTRARMFLIVLSLGIFVVFLHLLALKFSLYWRFQWLDIPLHFLGGMAVAFLVIYISRFSSFLNDIRDKNDKIIFWKLLSVVFVVAIGWEIFDYEIYISPLHPINYFVDTAIDIIMDTLGIIFSFIFNNLFFYDNKN